MSGSVVAISAVVFFVLLFINVPVFVSILAGCLAYFALSVDVPQLIIAQRFAAGIQNNALMAIPFFVCSGVLMNEAGVTRRLMNFCEVVTRRLPGGLAQVNVLLSTLMGGMSGSSLADAAMEAKMLVPEMEKRGHNKDFATAVTASSAMITPIIPPGIGMVVYGAMVSVSIGKLFVAGIGPGILLCLTMMIMVGVICKRRGFEVAEKKRVTAKEVWHAFLDAFFPLLLIVVILGSIRIGLCTPTEAGSVAVIYALVLGFAYRELNIKKLLSVLKETILTTAGIMMIVGAANAFSWILTREKVPQALANWMLGVVSTKTAFLIFVNLFLLVVGMLIEGNASLIVLGPLLAPLAQSYGVDPVQFGIIVVFNLGIGSLTPPMGTLMFVTCGVTGSKIKDFIRECVPFYVQAIICLLLITFVPGFCLWLVRLFY